MTAFTTIYESFFTLITDDMYLEIDEEQTHADCKGLLMSSIPLFEFPKQMLDFQEVVVLNESAMYFTNDLTLEEINILAMGMNQIWLQRQVTSVEMVRQKFSGVDFKLTSQASHLQRLMALLENTKAEHRRLELLYSRRKVENGAYVSNFEMLIK